MLFGGKLELKKPRLARWDEITFEEEVNGKYWYLGALLAALNR